MSFTLLLNQEPKLALVIGSCSYMYLFWCLFNIHNFVDDGKNTHLSYVNTRSLHRHTEANSYAYAISNINSENRAKNNSKNNEVRIAAAAALATASVYANTDDEDVDSVLDDDDQNSMFTNVVFAPTDYENSSEANQVNPASGEPMIGGTGGVDTSGDAYGFNSHDHAEVSHESDISNDLDMSDDSLSLSFDDSFSSFDNDLSSF